MNNDTINALKQKTVLLSRQKNYRGAAKAAAKLTEENPKDIENWWVLAQLQTQIGEYENAVKSYYQVCQGPSPVYVQAVERAVQISIDHELWQLGAAPARILARIRPDAKSHFSQGICWMMCGHFLTAEPSMLAALKLDPNNENYLEKLGLINLYIGRPEKAMDYFVKCRELYPEAKKANYNELWCTSYSDLISDEEIYAKHVRYGRSLEAKHENFEFVSAPNADREKLKIGFYSQDFYSHSVASFFLPIIENVNSDRWETYCYSDVKEPDEITQRIKNRSDHWRECVGKSDQQMVDMIRADQLDILIDLVGVIGDGRLEVYAMRAAPVQVTYLGYPNTTGLSRMDYRLTDEIADIPHVTEQWHAEQLSRLPNGFLCYQPNSEAPAVVNPPAKKNAQITFGSFNVYQKVSARCLTLWAQILTAIPESTLLMKSKPFNDENLQEHVWSEFEKLGVDRKRVELLSWTKTRESHLMIYDSIDIHLDTFPFNGVTTTCEALWQGVPTVTLAGNNHRSRVSASLMQQMGLEDWVAHTNQDYVDIAVRKAADLDGLESLRLSMRDRMQNSPLMDGPGFVDDLDASFRKMIEQKQQDKPKSN